MVAVPGPLLSNIMLDNERGPGNATITRFLNSKVKDRLQKTPDLSYKANIRFSAMQHT